MTRQLLRHSWARLAMALTVLSLAFVPVLLLRPHPAYAAGHRSGIVLTSAPLGIFSGQTAEIAFYTPAGPDGGSPPDPCRLLLVNALTGETLASRDFASGQPGGRLIWVAPNAAGQPGDLLPARTEVTGMLIGLLRQPSAHPTASLQAVDNETLQTVAALPAVQIPAVQ